VNVFLALTASACTPTNTTNWFIAAGSATSFNLNDLYAGPPLSAASVFAPANLTNSPGSFGSFTVTQGIPEPSTCVPMLFILTMAGGAFLTRKRADRRCTRREM
jgi:hypothetical protein